ncbi:hypothetical protein ACGFYZ_28800 [Streptomyces sp. NPDC048330]|uniref:hypothetical protein n=1 Tax=Streptomyces sp. NPDC048330 TaxID=3365533 RepID=UPI003711C72B
MDGLTPVSRSVWASDLVTDDGYAYVLARPFLLRTGDRISFESDRLVVARADGERVAVDGAWETRCGFLRGRRRYE